MKLHRFYVGSIKLENDLKLNDTKIIHQWRNVLRFDKDREVVLFNSERLVNQYKILEISKEAVRLELITELEAELPKNEVYLCFSLLKKDKNDWVLQKATELGVSHLVPMICDRTEKTGYDSERAIKIVTEASEQCGRSDIPRVFEPVNLEKLIEELNGKTELYVAEQGSPNKTQNMTDEKRRGSVAILIGPEGGWTDQEKQLFEVKKLKNYSLSEFTLRAETACVAAATLLQ